MQTLTLGSTSITVPALGIGTWAWGDRFFWSYGNDYDEQQLQAAFQGAVQAGVNFFDTAEVYGFGESERLLGRFLQTIEQPVLIATKYFPLPWRFNPGFVADALTASLKRLQVPTVDLYQVHWPLDFLLGQPALMNALADEVQQGRIKAVGVSNYSAEQMKQAHELLAARGVPLAVNQVQYSLLARQVERNGVLATARDLNVTLLAYSPLAQGLLTGKYAPDTDTTPLGARRIDPRFNAQGLAKLAPVVAALREIAQAYDRTPAQVALNWLITQGNVIPIPGAKNAQQAEQNAGALGWELSPSDRQRLAEVTANWS
jgi:aryl-alcohol dehydrogenase-like predicted oxidoreductase